MYRHLPTALLQQMFDATSGRPWCRLLRRARLAMEVELHVRATAAEFGGFVVAPPEGMH